MAQSVEPSWLQILAPSIPSTIAIVVGFYAFHYYALKRQKRQEVFDEIKKLHLLLDECVKVAEDAWKQSGKRAVESGGVMQLRGKLMQLSNTTENLVEKDALFCGLRELVRAFRKGVDEKIDIEGKPVTTVDDMTRIESSCPFEAIDASLKIRRAADRAFNQRHK